MNQIDILPKMLLHNQEDLVNFEHVFGLYSWRNVDKLFLYIGPFLGSFASLIN